jgi:hypothetical protein
MKARAALPAGLLAAWSGFGCTTGEGEGEVTSDKLYVEECWDDAFNLDPTFFAANPFRDTLQIRIQRGDDIQEVSDGVAILVNDVAAIRGGLLGQPLEVGLPPGVSPPGVPVEVDPDPARVSLALYLHHSCHLENGTVHAVAGSIDFSALFSGDPNEENADDRLTEASFSVTVADPRHELADGTYPAGKLSTVDGWFRFFFQRGQPAQPFP